MGGRRVICSVSVELNDDHMAILKFAEEQGGSLTYTKVSNQLPSYKDRGRFDRAIERLLQDGIVWEDSQGPETAYWFPSLMVN
jgi:hypothetical protein